MPQISAKLRSSRFVLTVVAALVLSACGGGGGGESDSTSTLSMASVPELPNSATSADVAPEASMQDSRNASTGDTQLPSSITADGASIQNPVALTDVGAETTDAQALAIKRGSTSIGDILKLVGTVIASIVSTSPVEATPVVKSPVTQVPTVPVMSVPPTPPRVVTPPVTPPAPPSVAIPPTDAARFLVQATYGPKMDEIAELSKVGYAAWLKKQFETPPLDTHWAYVIERKGPIGCTKCDAEHINAVMESFWYQAVKGPDQLRQRLVFALSQIFVVSTVNSPIQIQQDAHASYLDMLSRNAFGNFRTLLEQVATHPTMGHYLSHIKNEKEDVVTGRLPDENFAREVMQLFTVGLWELNADGSRKKDASGNDIPTYDQAEVMGMAKVFTGWSWGNGDWAYGLIKPTPKYNPYAMAWNVQMQNYPSHHSNSEKRIIRGVVIPANTSGTASLKIALDTLFNHPNVGPFIGSQLIKRFVTSNPSPQYIARVTAAFNDNGQGVRGDMQAVIKAVLMDTEARDNTNIRNPQFGKLREPLIRYADFLRAFNGQATSGQYKIWNLEDTVSSIGQNPLRAPSVFNWYKPTYAPPGAIQSQGLVAPEFQITDETTTTGYANYITVAAERNTAWWRDNVAKQFGTTNDYLAADYSAEIALVNNPTALVNRLDLLLVAGQLTNGTKKIVTDAVTSVSATANSGNSRVATAVAMIMLSPEYIVQK